jgi:hypothetical protein
MFFSSYLFVLINQFFGKLNEKKIKNIKMEEKRLIVYKDKEPVMKFYVKPKHTLADIQTYFEKQGYKATVYNGRKRLEPYDFDQITNGKILLFPLNIPETTYRKIVLTGMKDVDLKILSELSDRDLFQFCLSNKDAAELCRSETFWRNRFYNKYESLFPDFDIITLKPNYETWKKFYLYAVVNLEEYNDKNWSFLNIIDWDVNTDTVRRFMSNSYLFESQRSSELKFWLLNLGTEMTLVLPRDRYEELELFRIPISAATYGVPYFTPQLILNIVYQFYQEPITVEELRLQKEIENPYAEDYTEAQAEQGKITRLDLIGQRFYEGVAKDGSDVEFLFGT